MTSYCRLYNKFSSSKKEDDYNIKHGNMKEGRKNSRATTWQGEGPTKKNILDWGKLNSAAHGQEIMNPFHLGRVMQLHRLSKKNDDCKRSYQCDGTVIW